MTEPSSTTLARQRALALACGAAAAPLALGALEATMLSDAAPWTAFGAATRATFYACSPAIIAVAVLSLPTLVGSTRFGAALQALVGAGFCGALLAGLRGDAVLLAHPALWVGFIAICATLAAQLVLRRRWPATSWGIAALALAAGVAGWVANYRVAQGAYFEGHWALTNITMLALGLGVGELMLAATRNAATATRWRVYAASVAACAALLAASTTTTSDDAMREVGAETEVGRARLLVLGPQESTHRSAASIQGARAIELFDGRRPFEVPPRFDLDAWDVLFLASESIRRDDTSLHDPKLGTTPNMLRWKAGGAIDFPRGYAPSSGTLQSVGSWFGLAPVACLHLDIYRPHWAGKLRDETETVAERFAATGRHTFWIGHNFRNLWHTKVFGFEQGFEHVQRTDEPNRKASLKADTKTADAVVAHLRKLSPTERYFGFVMFSAPHASYVKHYADMPAKSHRDRYRQEIRKVDEQLGRLYDALKETGRLEHTIVVITADHGEEFNDHGATGHNRSLFEESIRVPLLLWFPGARVKDPTQPVSNAWFIPWLMLRDDRLAAGLAPRLADGWSALLEAADGHVVAEIVRKTQTVAALVGRKTKFHYNVTAGRGFAVDLANDPDEKTRRTKLAPHETDLLRRFVAARDGCKRYVETGERPPAPSD